MPDVFLGEFNTDILPPAVSNRFPADGAVGVARNVVISFDVTDVSGSGVDLATLNVLVNGVAAITAGVFQTGFTGAITPITDGYNVTVDRIVNFPLDEEVTVTVDASDLAPIPNDMPTDTWDFHTTEGIIASPRLSAVGLNELVYLSWQIDENVRVDLFELRRSTTAFPVTPTEGDLVFSGTSQIFNDTDVVNGVTYFYTVFVIRKYVLGVPEYIPYETQASAQATPRLVVSEHPLEPEYVPARGEMGFVTNPVPGGVTISAWGTIYGGVVRQEDVIAVRDGMPIFSPVTGVVIGIEDSDMAAPGSRLSTIMIEGSSGIEYHIDGVLIATDIVVGSRVGARQRIGSTIAGNIDFRITKLPTGGFGRRSIRPAYFYATIESREGRR